VGITRDHGRSFQQNVRVAAPLAEQAFDNKSVDC
jgi:hypothetical protein